jgi:hypothetical protein
MPLLIRKGHKGSAVLSISYPALTVHSEADVSDAVLDKEIIGTISRASLTSEGLLNFRRFSSRDGVQQQVQVNRRTTRDAYFGLSILYSPGSYGSGIACFSREGHYVLLDANGKIIAERDLDLKSPPERFYKTSSAHQTFGPVIETHSELIVFSNGEYPTRIIGKGNSIITASFLAPQTLTNVAVGYEDGVVEVHVEVKHGYFRMEEFGAHSGRILHLGGQADFNGFLSVGADGTVQVWRNPIKGPTHAILSERKDITVACLADGTRKLISAHKTSQMALWDISGKSGRPVTDDALNLFGPEMGIDLRSYCVSNGKLWISSGHQFGGAFTWQVTRDKHMLVGRATRDYPQRGSEAEWRAGYACWSADRSAALIFHNNDSDQQGLTAHPTLVHLAVDGAATWSTVELSKGKPTAYGSRPGRPEFAIGFEDGRVARLDTLESKVIAEYATAPDDYNVRDDPEKLFCFNWCRYNATGEILVAITNSRPRLFILFVETGEWIWYQIGEEGGAPFIMGPVALASCGKVAYAACSNGDVIGISLDCDAQKIVKRYGAPRSRYTRDYSDQISFLDVSSDGHILAGASRGSVITWMTAGRDKGRRFQARAEITQLSFIPGTRRLLIVDSEGGCSIFDAQIGYYVADITQDAVSSQRPLIGRDGKVAAVRTAGNELEGQNRLVSFSTFRSAFQLYEYLKRLRTHGPPAM